MSKTKYLIKNMGILTISNFSSKILVFLLVPLYTSVLSTTEYGTYDLTISTATLLFPILTLNIVDAVMRFLMDKDKNKKNIASIAIKVIFLSVIVFGSVMYLLNITKLWQDVYGLEKYIFLYYISYVWNQFLIQFAKGLEKVKAMGIAGIISTIVTIIANIFFLLILKWGLIGFFIANILSQIISATYLSVLVRIWEYIDFEAKDPQLKREMLNYSIPLIATVVGWWINSTADRYVVSFIVGVSANGLLSVAYKIPQIINTLQGIFIQAWQISAIKEYGDNETAK
ncbi:TPA: oligosaccharide flippase family protein, partial [Enterococcus faecium]|nr:oligosaccharide flippase family protein [Enterococcus faecium]